MTKEQAKEEKSISELLDFAIHECMQKKDDGKPEIILMHWENYGELDNDYKLRFSNILTHAVDVSYYRGIRIVRSLDLYKDEIKVY
jgi:hypothetical protein